MKVTFTLMLSLAISTPVKIELPLHDSQKPFQRRENTKYKRGNDPSPSKEQTTASKTIVVHTVGPATSTNLALKFGSDDFEDPLEIEWDAMEADLGSCYGMNPLENNGTPRSNAGGVGHHLPRDTRDSTATASRMNESAEKSRIKVVCIKGQPEPNRVLRNSTIGQSTATQTLASPTPTHTFVVECERPEYLTRVPFEVVGGQVIPRDPSVSTVICDAICYRICMTILGCAGCAIMGGLGLIGRELFTPESDDYN